MNLDWALLRRQKIALLELSLPEKDDKLIQGIIHIIDAIQDYAVDHGDATEQEVFGESL